MFRRFVFLLAFQILAGSLLVGNSVRVVNRSNQSKDLLKALDNTSGTYISILDLERILQAHSFINEKQEKIVLYVNDHRIKISAETSFILVDERVFQLPVQARKDSGDIYVPATPFFKLMKSVVMPGLAWDPVSKLLDIDVVEFNITSLKIDEKANGTILRLGTRERFKKEDISTFVNKNGWFYITIRHGLMDTSEVLQAETRGVIKKITVDQLQESAQLAFQLRGEVEGHEFYQSGEPHELVVTLRTPLSKSAARIKDVKSRWRLDTVVLDAGHGGKDRGTTGYFGTKEKDIVLDVVKRIGRKLEKNSRIKVVYTREEDVFIPLYERTRIANENNGKIFVSIHANASKNRNIKGFETYLLRPGKTRDAIEVSSRENAVIKLEDNRREQYQELTGENLIMAT
ncbi:MAG: N-acetylmuramoyl-L-alanine amidase, partial [Fidelibacterota bacterium]